MKKAWDKVKEIAEKSWPWVKAFLRAFPRWMFTTRTGLIVLSALLVRFGIPEDTVKAIIEFFSFASGITPEELREVGTYTALSVGTLFANEDKKFLKKSLEFYKENPISAKFTKTYE